MYLNPLNSLGKPDVKIPIAMPYIELGIAVYANFGRTDFFDRLVRCSVVITSGSDLEELQAYFNNLHVNIIASFVDTYGIAETKLNSVGAVAGLPVLKSQTAARLGVEGSDFLYKNSMSKNFAAVLLSPMIKRFLESDTSSKRMSLGQCVLGASRLYLSADHAYYPCEKVAGHSFARIETIETGIDTDRIADLIRKFYEMAEKRCSGYWMSSRCSACIALACSGDHLDIEKYGHYYRGTKAWEKSALEMVTSAKLNLHNR